MAKNLNQLASQRRPLRESTPLMITEVVELSELTEEEESDRFYLERKVERAFYEAGKALQELRNRRLYRSTHKTFESYCQERFGFSRRHINYLITAVDVVDNLKMGTIGSQKSETETRTNGAQILPTSERQVRPLTKLEPEEQREAWTKAVESAGGKVPSGRIVKDVVQRIRERTRVPNPYKVGEVCQLIAKDDPELRGKGGCWGIVSEVHEFSCTVETWEGELTVRLLNLKSLEFSEEECQDMKVLCERLQCLSSDDLEEAASCNLAFLGKLERPYLTALEEKLLQVLEAQKY